MAPVALPMTSRAGTPRPLHVALVILCRTAVTGSDLLSDLGVNAHDIAAERILAKLSMGQEALEFSKLDSGIVSFLRGLMPHARRAKGNHRLASGSARARASITGLTLTYTGASSRPLHGSDDSPTTCARARTDEALPLNCLRCLGLPSIGSFRASKF